MKIAIVGLLVGVLGFISPAIAADWKLVNNAEDFLDYIDATSFKKNENIRKVWELRNYKNPQPLPIGKSYRSMKVLNEYDCKNETTRSTYLIAYSDDMGTGSTVAHEESPSSKWKPVIPETNGEAKIKVVCSK